MSTTDCLKGLDRFRRDFDLLLLPVEMTMAEEEAGNMFVLNQRKNLVAEVIPNEKRFTVRLM
ncbi:MAG: hypothetical protein HY703_06600, partial [Gemmatimonadetes bacterium]|nr:hypothetical protein [Gemmatimonadota bacterium]